MNAIELLQEQLKTAHEMMEGTMGDVTSDIAHFSDTNKALPAGAAYVHAVTSEDFAIAAILQQKTPLLGVGTQIGLSEPIPSFTEWDKYEAWVKRVKIDLPVFRAYAKKVFAATEEYLRTLTEADLDQKVKVMDWGTHPVAYILNNFVILHIVSLTGEISAAKGIQGLKGYPF